MRGRYGRAVILTALGLEYDALRAWLTSPRLEVHPSGTRYELGRLKLGSTAWDVVLADIGESNQAAAILPIQAIETFKPDLMLFVGVAASLVDSVQLGDVVAATRVDAYHRGKHVALHFRGRSVTWPSAWPLEQAVRQVRRERHWQGRLSQPPSQPSADVLLAQAPEVHVKPILAGEVTINSRESRLYRFLREHYNDAAAIEIEESGLSSADHASGAVPTMVIRGISDLAGGAMAESDKVARQRVAARHAAAFAFELLAILDPKTLRQTHENQAASVESRPTEQVQPEHPKLDNEQLDAQSRFLTLNIFLAVFGVVATAIGLFDLPSIAKLFLLLAGVGISLLVVRIVRRRSVSDLSREVRRVKPLLKIFYSSLTVLIVLTSGFFLQPLVKSLVGSPDARDRPTGSSTTASSTTTPNSFPNEREKALIAHIPASYRAQCLRDEDPYERAIAAVYCIASSGVSRVYYQLYRNAAELNDDYAGVLDAENVAPGGGNCEQGRVGDRTYKRDTGKGGRVACYHRKSDNSSWIVWTYDPVNIMGLGVSQRSRYSGAIPLVAECWPY